MPAVRCAHHRAPCLELAQADDENNAAAAKGVEASAAGDLNTVPCVEREGRRILFTRAAGT